MRRRKVKPNLIDRAIAAVAPGYGVQRLRARHQYSALAGGYDGARRDRRATQEWKTRGGDADSDVNLDLPVLRERRTGR